MLPPDGVMLILKPVASLGSVILLRALPACPCENVKPPEWEAVLPADEPPTTLNTHVAELATESLMLVSAISIPA